MENSKLILIITILFVTPDIFIQSFYVRHMEFFVNSSGKCPEEDKNPVHFLGSLTKISTNKYVFDGDIAIYDDIKGDIMV